MATRYDRLPDAQNRLLPALAPLKDLGFVLYGGTAIALQLGHRLSIDFDFFTEQLLEREAIIERMPSLLSSTTLQDEKQTWTVQVRDRDGERPVKVSFFTGLRFGRVGHPQSDDQNHLAIASLDDLLGHKLKVLLQRVEAKDYQDIAAMLRADQTLERGIGAALSLFPNFPSSEALKALVYFDGGDLDNLSDSDRAILIKAADQFAQPCDMPILNRQLGAD